MRLKEESRDYRYFDEPDLPPLVVPEGAITAALRSLPELPAARQRRYVTQLHLAEDAAVILCRDPAVVDYFEKVVGGLANRVPAVKAAALAANWIVTEILAMWPRSGIDPPACPVAADRLADLLTLLAAGKLSGKSAKLILAELKRQPSARPEDLMVDMGLQLVSDPQVIEKWCRCALRDHPQEVEAYRGGKTGVLEFLVGRALALSLGKAAPELVRRSVTRLLGPPD